jgi:hypothetical protein
MFVIGSITIIVIAFAVGTFWIINKKINNKPPKTLKPLPVLAEGYRLTEDKTEFFRKIINREFVSYSIDWLHLGVDELIFIYRLDGFPSIHKEKIKHDLIILGYDVRLL